MNAGACQHNLAIPYLTKEEEVETKNKTYT